MLRGFNRLLILSKHKMLIVGHLSIMLTLIGVLGIAEDSFCSPLKVSKSKIINVDYYHITEFPNGFEIYEAVQLFKNAKEKIKNELGIRLRLRKIEVLNKAPFEYFENLDLASRQLEILEARKYIRNNNKRGQRTLSLINRGAIRIGALWWITGIASSVCDPRGVGLLFTAPQNYEGASRVKESEIIFIHELGHLLGASHEAFTVMDSGALQLSIAGFELNFSRKAKREIVECLYDKK